MCSTGFLCRTTASTDFTVLAGSIFGRRTPIATARANMSTASTSPKPIHEPGTADGWHGVITPDSPFPPEAGRYHLYIGLFCPFAHRANLVRHLFSLTSFIDISIVKPYPKGDEKGWPGWRFPKSDDEYPGATRDKLFGSEYLHEVYFRADKEYKGRYSVPLLWDKKGNTIVNNVRLEPCEHWHRGAGLTLFAPLSLPMPLPTRCILTLTRRQEYGASAFSTRD